MSMSNLYSTAHHGTKDKERKNVAAQGPSSDVRIQIEKSSRSSSQHHNMGGNSSEGTAPSETAVSDAGLSRRQNHSNFYTAPKKVKAAKKLQRNISEHSILADIADMRSMEVALVQLLDDFHTGKLQAFGRHCSTEQMEAIRDQQERLAKLHFEVGGQRDVLSQKGTTGLGDHMNQLVSALEQLSQTIEKLHPQMDQSQSNINEES